MSIETLDIDVEFHEKQAHELLGNLMVTGRLPSLLDFRNTAMGEQPVVGFTDDLRSLYQTLYPLVNSFIAKRQELFGMFPVDLQIHTDRRTRKSLSIVLGFGEVKPHWPVYVSWQANWVPDEFEMKVRNSPRDRTPWNILVDWHPEWVEKFQAGIYLPPDSVIDIINDLETQFRIYNGFHNAGELVDQDKEVFWRSCTHYGTPVLDPQKRWAKINTVLELREGAYEFSYHLKRHDTVEDGKEWGI